MPDTSLTIAIVSCNRLHYLKALVESLRKCIAPDDVQWIIVDNASVEEGLREYIESLDFVEHKVFQERRDPSREYALAHDRFLELASGKYLLPLTDDLQVIVKSDWLRDCIGIAEEHPQIGSIGIDAQRRVTLDRFFGRKGWRRVLPFVEPYGSYELTGGCNALLSYGNQKPGVVTALANALTRTEIWRRLGTSVVINRPQTVEDAGAGFEDVILDRYIRSGMKLERYLLRIPIMASIVTDMRGTQARIRGNRRYGRYLPPPNGNGYYRIWDESELGPFQRIDRPVSFEEIVQPIGFELPYDDEGNLLKNPLQESDEFEWIHPSVAGVDIR